MEEFWSHVKCLLMGHKIITTNNRPLSLEKEIIGLATVTKCERCEGRWFALTLTKPASISVRRYDNSPNALNIIQTVFGDEFEWFADEAI